jgi:Reverse transcriptase (RNA-dependent DNA polymerase)
MTFFPPGAFPSLPDVGSSLSSVFGSVSGLKIAHINAQSLPAHIEIVRNILVVSNLDILAVSETWLSDSINDVYVSVPGYRLHRHDRSGRRGGGVGIYIREDLSSSVLTRSQSPHSSIAEYLIVQVRSPCFSALCCVVYNPPGFVVLDKLFDDISSHLFGYSHVFVLGDFNIDISRSLPSARSFLGLLSSLGLTPLQFGKTHHAGSGSCIDHLAVLDESLVSCHGHLGVPGVSLHDLIFCVYKLPVNQRKPLRLTRRRLNSINLDALHSDAQKAPWRMMYSAGDINSKVQVFNYIIMNLLDAHAPLRTYTVKRQPVSWMTSNILKLLADKRRARRRYETTHSDVDRESFRKIRNRCRQVIRNSKCSYFRNLFSDSQPISCTWKRLRSSGMIPNRKRQLDESSLPGSLDCLNKHFLTVPPYDPNLLFSSVCSISGPSASSSEISPFSFSPISFDDLSTAISSAKSCRPGSDDVPIEFIRMLLPVIHCHLLHLINCSLCTGFFPDDWKKALVLPIPKISSPTSFVDFRPISILPCLSKVLENLVAGQIRRHLDNFNLLHKSQSGFRRFHSTASAVLDLVEDLRWAREHSELSSVVLFDFSKAFDCIIPAVLFAKLRYQFKFSESALKWVRSYFTGRSQCVTLGDRCSDWSPVVRGVPQGSVLGPLFFILYVNDIFLSIKHCESHLFADDLRIHISFPLSSLRSHLSLLQEDIDAVGDWALKHGLSLNASKTQFAVFARRALLESASATNLSLHMDDSTVTPLPVVKYLGVYLDTGLTFDDQVSHVCSRVLRILGCLRACARPLPVNIRLLLIRCLAFPHFEYCNVLYTGLSVYNINRLQRVQNCCVRFIKGNISQFDHVSPYFDEFGLLKFFPLVYLRCLVFFYKLLLGRGPLYLRDRISCSAREGGRHRGRLVVVPRYTLSATANSFFVWGGRNWNYLVGRYPQNFVNDQLSFRAFARLVKNLCLEGALPPF